MAAIELGKVVFRVSARALFRYGCVSEVLSAELAGVTLARAVKAVSARPHYDHLGRPRPVRPRSLYRWLASYRSGGLAAIEPASRARTRTSVVLPAELITFIDSEKREDSHASIPEIIRRARERGILQAHERIDRTTLYRAARRMELPVGRGRHHSAPQADVRRFAFPNRMMMLLCDGKHFRAGPWLRQRVAFFFLDDATRMGLEVVVGTSESSELFARGLYLVVRRWGIADMLYLDRGPGFIANDSARLCRQCSILPVLGQARCPQCHGKIEKFNQYAKHNLLRGITDAGVDDRLEALELRVRHFLLEQYNHRPHEALGGQTPAERWAADQRELRPLRSQGDLERRFLLTEKRAVALDNVLSCDGVAYEVPRGHAGSAILVYRCALRKTVSIMHAGRLVCLHPVDLAANATARRTTGRPPEQDQGTPAIRSAARLAFERDLSPVTDAEGGFVSPRAAPPSPTEQSPRAGHTPPARQKTKSRT
jgi:transposase InsO family protein